MIEIQKPSFFEKTSLLKEAGHLTQEKIFINNKLIQKTEQDWASSNRTLEVGDHKHLYRYQNGKLIGLSSNKVELNYIYDTAGLLIEKKAPLSYRKTSYNRSGLPEFVDSPIGDERLIWDRSGKLSLYKSREEEKSFSYTPRGYLQSAGNLDYTFDFGGKGTGVRTESPTHSMESLDELGRVYSEEIRNTYAKVYIDLYSYANGDPINFIDPDGRFASQAYQQLKASTLSMFSNPRVQGGLRTFASSAEITAGTALTFSSAGWATLLGGVIIAHGMDNFVAGTHQMFSGQQRSTATELLLQKTGMSAQKAYLANDWMSLAGTLGGSSAATKIYSNSNFATGFTKLSTASFERAQIEKNFKPLTKSNFRYNLTQLTRTNPGKGFQAHHVFPQRFRRDFSSKGINIHDPKYGTWWEIKSHQVTTRQYNDTWFEILRETPSYKKDQLLQHGKQMMLKQEIKIHF